VLVRGGPRWASQDRPPRNYQVMSSATPIEPSCLDQDQLLLDDVGFSRLYRTTARDLVVFFARRTYDAEAAADLMAETFAKAYLGRRRFRGATEEAARAWLFGIARRRLAMYVRRGKAERRALRRLGLERPRLVEGECGRIEELAGLDAMRGTLAEHLGRLAPAQRSALELRVVRELPYPDVAARLSITEQAARARVSRALRALGSALDGVAATQR
jgi:RNA polymerase sigma factor (sigma-70 family)